MTFGKTGKRKEEKKEERKNGKKHVCNGKKVFGISYEHVEI